MNRIVAVILAIVLSVASATAGIRHYCDTSYCTIHTVFVTSSTSTTTLVIENKRDYYGEDLVYRNDTLEMVLTDVGYVDASGNYHYYMLDYQGNVRQVVDAQGNVLEQNDYYPYGGLFGESASHQSYKYSGKELETMNGLNTYDFHARPYYYPALQFHSPDLLSEKNPWNSPYLYSSGNPINRIDPSGMADYFNQKGKYITTIDDGIDVRMMLFTNSTKIEDAQKAISEKLYTPVPSETVIKAMEQVYEKTEKTGNEAGFIVGESGTVSRIVEGTSGEIDNETWGIAQKDIIESNDMISYDVHSHPEQNVSGYNEGPSVDDKKYVVGNMPGVLLGYDVKTYITNGYLGKETYKSVKRTIIFYNSNEVLYRQEYDKFKKTIKNINK